VKRPATPIIVHPSNAGPAQPTILATGPQNPHEPMPATDIVHIKSRVGTLAQIGPPLIQKTWFVALQGVPILAWLMAFAWRRHAENLANNPRLRRQRQVAQTVRAGLADLRRLAGASR